MATAFPIQVTNFRDLERWDVKYFTGRIVSKYPLVPLSEIVYEHNEKIRPSEYPDQSFKILGVNNTAGILHAYDTLGKKIKQPYKKVSAGDFAYNPYRINVGSIGLVPDEHDDGYISPAYVVFGVDKTKILPEIFQFILKSEFFNKALRAATAGSVRMNLTYPLLLNLKIPIPPIEAQAKILDYFRSAKEKSSELLFTAEPKKKEIETFLYSSLGVPFPHHTGKKRKLFKIQWQNIGRWSYGFLKREFLGLTGIKKSRYPILELGDFLISTLNGYCIKPSLKPTSTKTLKLNAISPLGHLDKDQSKFVRVNQKLKHRFDLKKDDILICRSIGSYDQIAKSTKLEEDLPGHIFPDIIIRVRVKTDRLDPCYVQEILNSPFGKSYFQSNARTAVGMWKIGSEDIRKFPIPTPPLETQRKLTEKIRQERLKITQLTTEANKVVENACEAVGKMILGLRPVEDI
jgi:type I restriction enzyme S subunit